MRAYQYYVLREMNINKTKVILLAVHDEQIILQKYKISDSQNPNVKYETKCEQNSLTLAHHLNNVTTSEITMAPSTHGLVSNLPLIVS